ncbi:MAG: hypothetical protein ABIU05_05140 [Nitrospirales bacterium]
MTNTALSSTGQQEQLAKLAEESLKEWEWLGRILHDTEAAHVRLTTVLFTIKPAAEDKWIQCFRAQEIRSGMVAFNQNERDAAYVKASERNQLEILLAMQTAPTGNWITPDIQQRTDRMRAQRTQPDTFGTYEQNEFLHERLAGIADHVAYWLKSYGAPPATVATALGLAA